MAERQRSFWAWGWADRAPTADMLEGLAPLVEAQLGLGGLKPLALPELADIQLRAPRCEAPARLPFVTDAREARIFHTYGRAYRDQIRGLYGDFGSAPDLVATPADEAQVAQVLAWASQEGVAVVPWGGGTSVVGGVEAAVGAGYAGALALDMRAMNQVIEVDLASRAARIQAGATGPELEAQLSAHGLSLRHYPQSFEFSTLGGWIATRAGGHFATLYTHIDDLVASLRMVTPTGTFASLRVPGSGAGPSPDRFALGSEGVLGVITEAWMRVQARPRWRLGASFHFGSFEAAVEAARAISQSGLYPSNCRLLDPAEAALNHVASDGSAVLIVGFESADHPLDPWMQRAAALCEAHGGSCPAGHVRRDAGGESGDAAGAWKQAFVEAPYLQSSLIALGVMADTFETACTWAAFGELYVRVRGAVLDALKRECGGGQITCRFTHVYPDGPAPYFTFVGKARPGAELEQWASVKAAASDALAACGATITHHHAVGRTHRPWYDKQRPEPFYRMLVAAKAAVDPAGVLNPGVLVDPKPLS